MKRLFLLILFISQLQYSQAQSINVFRFFDPEHTSVKNMEQLNTEASDIAPFFVGENLFFSSQEISDLEKSRERKNTVFYNIYSLPLSGNGMLGTSVSRTLVPGFGNEYHEGPAAYCAATNELFVTKSNVLAPDIKKRMFTKENIRLRLVIMKKENGEWVDKEEFPYNDPRYHFAHPAINATGDTLIFSSDMPGGFGKSDLYMSVRKNGKWAEPTNLGEGVNTDGNEMFPTFLPGNLLAFSSDGYESGIGNLDIWLSQLPQLKTVTNAGSKINSMGDDFDLVIHPNEAIGYFSSSREGGQGSDDIYSVACKNYELNLITKAADTKKILPGSTVKIFGAQGNAVAEKVTASDGSLALALDFGTKYKIEAQKDGYRLTTDYLDLSDIPATHLTKIVYLEPGYEFRGTVVDAANQVPIANAKIEVENKETKTTLTSNDSGTFSFTVNPDNEYALTVSAKNYFGTEEIMSTDGMEPGIKTEVFELYSLKKGTRITLNNIYYDFDKWNIRADAAAELDKVVKVLTEYPKIKIRLESHTDSRGSAAYNMKLSERRAKSCFQYLVAKGIDSSRMVYKGYGESQLVNRCSDGVECSDEEHQQNRRTVIEITEE